MCVVRFCKDYRGGYPPKRNLLYRISVLGGPWVVFSELRRSLGGVWSVVLRSLGGILESCGGPSVMFSVLGISLGGAWSVILRSLSGVWAVL